MENPGYNVTESSGFLSEPGQERAVPGLLLQLAGGDHGGGLRQHGRPRGQVGQGEGCIRKIAFDYWNWRLIHPGCTWRGRPVGGGSVAQS